MEEEKEGYQPKREPSHLDRCQVYTWIKESSQPAKELEGGINPFIGRYVVKSVPPNPSGGDLFLKIKAMMTISGLFVFEGATAVEEPKALKKKVKKDLPAIYMTSSLDKSIINELMAKEGDMHASNKLVSETEDKKNALEEYVNDTCDKLEGKIGCTLKREKTPLTEKWIGDLFAKQAERPPPKPIVNSKANKNQEPEPQTAELANKTAKQGEEITTAAQKMNWDSKTQLTKSRAVHIKKKFDCQSLGRDQRSQRSGRRPTYQDQA
ncbi:hypothetical protein PPACK8108_LOCUS24638 [Phakopsora pachyrhizi]|uniref:Uncharacterized protein n=1 Tax=Phakopsora pachyrhizi TaxID=170000 RepID=A0AAV0BT13_PHAPC|nr:hypothetical protein PPACK8108_LOCUS24638 [Phakopsora pachyrhizi]